MRSLSTNLAVPHCYFGRQEELPAIVPLHDYRRLLRAFFPLLNHHFRAARVKAATAMAESGWCPPLTSFIGWGSQEDHVIEEVHYFTTTATSPSLNLTDDHFWLSMAALLVATTKATEEAIIAITATLQHYRRVVPESEVWSVHHLSPPSIHFCPSWP